MSVRLLSAALLAVLVLAPAAPAQDNPLTGEGQNMEIVANSPIPEGSGTDLEIAGNYAYVGFFGGFVIVDISDPRSPKRVGTVECGGGGHDIGLSVDATLLYFAADDTLGDCGDNQGTAIFDVRDKTRPQALASLSTTEGSHTVTTDGWVLSSNNYASENVYLYDITDARAPKPLVQTTTPGPSAFHDSFFDHRPDGKVLLYGASGEGHDIFDVTDPSKPQHLQRVTDPEVSFSHQLEPNFKRDVIIASDEWMGGGTAGACGKVPGAAPITPVPGPGAATDLGAYSFYRADPATGLFTGVGEKLGTFNIAFEAPNTGGCTSHVFWQAPDINRMLAGWYTHGTRVIEFTDPANPTEVGWFEPTGGDTWAAKPHKGYIFTGDLARGMDVLRFTGAGWPKDAPAADVQRGIWNGFARATPAGPAPPVITPTPSPTARQFGRVKAALRLKVPGRRGRKVRLTVSFVDAGAAVVGRARVSKRTGKRVRLRLSGVAEVGRYRYIVRAGRRVLKRGRFSVRAAPGVSLPAGKVISARAR